MTKQATFNKVARHLLRQGRRAMRRNPTTLGDPDLCVLHADGGLRCAAGVLVTRKDYDPKWEGPHAVVRKDGGSAVCRYLRAKGHDLELVGDLQRVHDRERSDRWPVQLRNIAKCYDLSAAVVDAWEETEA